MVFSFILQNDGSKPKNFWVKWELNTPLEAKVCNLDFKKRRIPKYKVQTKPYFLKSCHIGKCGIEQSSETN
jgi:hypothetical protein